MKSRITPKNLKSFFLSKSSLANRHHFQIQIQFVQDLALFSPLACRRKKKTYYSFQLVVPIIIITDY